MKKDLKKYNKQDEISGSHGDKYEYFEESCLWTVSILIFFSFDDGYSPETRFFEVQSY
jgi:hypothetical protein